MPQRDGHEPCREPGATVVGQHEDVGEIRECRGVRDDTVFVFGFLKSFVECLRFGRFAGVSGIVWGGCCEIQALWVDEPRRGHGIDSRQLRVQRRPAFAQSPPVEFRDHLLAALRYPWAPAADHAAEALVALRMRVPHERRKRDEGVTSWHELREGGRLARVTPGLRWTLGVAASLYALWAVALRTTASMTTIAATSPPPNM